MLSYRSLLTFSHTRTRSLTHSLSLSENVEIHLLSPQNPADSLIQKTKHWYFLYIFFQHFSLFSRCVSDGCYWSLNRGWFYLVLHGLDVRITCPSRRFVGDIAHQTRLAMVLHSRCNGQTRFDVSCTKFFEYPFEKQNIDKKRSLALVVLWLSNMARFGPTNFV